MRGPQRRPLTPALGSHGSHFRKRQRSCRTGTWLCRRMQRLRSSGGLSPDSDQGRPLSQGLNEPSHAGAGARWGRHAGWRANPVQTTPFPKRKRPAISLRSQAFFGCGSWKPQTIDYFLRRLVVRFDPAVGVFQHAVPSLVRERSRVRSSLAAPVSAHENNRQARIELAPPTREFLWSM